MAKNGSGLTAHWRSLVGEFRWPLGGGLLLILFISALAWLRTPSYASLRPTRFDLLPVGREELAALPASVRGVLLYPNPPEISVSDLAEAVRRSDEGDDSRRGASGCAYENSRRGSSCSPYLGRCHR